ncbi:unnamed protein product [Anisakis simplex]|uniref:Fes1 domain-containing protein n=1 Tax=Anisakis simplex TaxID=6269 RepID=A0A0M3KC16_ANISI|nr:unnamed protein product [Anisakis simplex]
MVLAMLMSSSSMACSYRCRVFVVLVTLGCLAAPAAAAAQGAQNLVSNGNLRPDFRAAAAVNWLHGRRLPLPHAPAHARGKRGVSGFSQEYYDDDGDTGEQPGENWDEDDWRPHFEEAEPGETAENSVLAGMIAELMKDSQVQLVMDLDLLRSLFIHPTSRIQTTVANGDESYVRQLLSLLEPLKVRELTFDLLVTFIDL